MVRLALLAALSAAASATVSIRVLRALEQSASTDVIVNFASNSRIANANTEDLPREERAQFVFDTLNAESSILTAPAVKLAKEAGVKAEPYWIVPSVALYGADAKLVEQLKGLPNVKSVDVIDSFSLPVLPASEFSTTNTTVEWGVNLIGAPAVWAKGNKGKGVVVANIDTGVRGTHEALKGNFRSEYGWYEPSTKSKVPSDGNGHGTHTIGTIAGGLGIGVAPEAQWIACVGCPQGSCPRTDLLACAQWVLCPTDTDGNKPNCKLAPHVVSNSWGSNTNGQTWYEESILAWRKAGILPVFSNGNAGPSCGTVGSPGDSPSVIGVGATDSADALASFSSKGPEPLQKRIKPDVSAPGKLVRSAWNTGDALYNTISGTSMAAPHVAGAAALILSANPGASYDTIYKLFTANTDTATLKPSGANCGGVSDSKYPNNDYGYGRINVAKALSGVVPSPTPAPTTTKPSC